MSVKHAVGVCLNALALALLVMVLVVLLSDLFALASRCCYTKGMHCHSACRK